MSEDGAGSALARAGGILSGAEARPWAVPAVGRSAGGHGGPLTAGRLESIEEEARESGRAAGHQEGYAAGQAEVMRRVEQLEQIIAGLAQPVSHLDAEVEQELLEMVMAIARRLIRRELKTNPGEIIGVVREGIASLPIGERKVTLQLHPEDAALVRDVFGMNEGGPACRIVEDPSLSRGGARISTDISIIDATLETRISRVFDRLLGGERQADEGDAE
ncbi:MAG TPA: flagellar assembly protein FliH [Gammaproteobacteria bacterium]|nr:flagellar assembly protein FliH [Gammaproteobacteria bacterium]